MAATVNNYGGKQPDNTQNIKQFYVGTPPQLWTFKPTDITINGAVKNVITPTIYADVLIKKDLIVEGSILNPSDIKLKKDVTEIVNSEILNLTPVEFIFKLDKTSKKHYGFIAQDLEKIFPDLVSDNIRDYKTVNYLELIPIMLSKMKQMQEEIDSLKEKCL